MNAAYFAVDYDCDHCGHSLLFDHRYHLQEASGENWITYTQVTDGCRDGCPCTEPSFELGS